MNTAEEFWLQVQKSDTCWLWTAHESIDYHGRVRWMGKMHGAHRVSWRLANNAEIPHGLFVCHRCDTPACVNPDHLFLGTCKQNMEDMISKSRHRNQKKTHCKRGHELSENNVYKRPGRERERQCKICRDVQFSLIAEKRKIQRKTGQDLKDIIL